MPDDIESIEFKNISFTYPNGDKKALNNISFSVNKGEKIAIVGENGAGKTTLVKLLSRFYKIDDGAILINGVPIGNYSYEACLLYTSPSPRDLSTSRMPSSA